MTRIFFDRNGKPSWRNVATAQLMRMQTPCQVDFTDNDRAWFRKPLERSE